MRPIRLLAAAAALVAVLPAMASAQSFNRADRDRDGVVSYAEARRVMPRLTEVTFSKCDLDRTGRLDRGQWACLQGVYNALYRDF